MGTQGSGIGGVGKEWTELRMEAMGAMGNIALDMRLMQVCWIGIWFEREGKEKDQEWYCCLAELRMREAIGRWRILLWTCG